MAQNRPSIKELGVTTKTSLLEVSIRSKLQFKQEWLEDLHHKDTKMALPLPHGFDDRKPTAKDTGNSYTVDHVFKPGASDSEVSGNTRPLVGEFSSGSNGRNLMILGGVNVSIASVEGGWLYTKTGYIQLPSRIARDGRPKY